MFFSIDADDRYVIRGWVAPDNPSVTPRVIISVPDRDDISLEANQLRPDIRELGIHNTGHVGFIIDETIIPDLRNLDYVEILEAESKTAIFRRFIPSKHVEKKLFIFNSCVVPQQQAMRNLYEQFSLPYTECERFPLETMIVLITNSLTRSICFSGRPNFNRYITFLETGEYIKAAILRDPFEELADRLLFLRLLSKSGNPGLISRYAVGLAPLMTFAGQLPLDDPKGVLKSFRQITDTERAALTSPMVRMLGCSLDDTPSHHHISLALDHLAAMDVVGTRAQYSVFRSMMEHSIGSDILGPDEPSSFQSAPMLARELSRMGIVADLLEYDVALYALANEAIKSGLEEEPEKLS